MPRSMKTKTTTERRSATIQPRKSATTTTRQVRRWQQYLFDVRNRPRALDWQCREKAMTRPGSRHSTLYRPIA